jgi:hypothetical protein
LGAARRRLTAVAGAADAARPIPRGDVDSVAEDFVAVDEPCADVDAFARQYAGFVGPAPPPGCDRRRSLTSNYGWRAEDYANTVAVTGTRAQASAACRVCESNVQPSAGSNQTFL